MARALSLPPVTVVGWLASAWRALASAVARAWAEWLTARELESLSDRQLRDIGLSRDEIPYAAQEGRDYSFFRR